MEARLIHDRDKDRVEKIAGLLEEIATLRADLARVREQWANTEIDRWTAVQELSRERERHQDLRQVVKEYRTNQIEGRHDTCAKYYVHTGLTDMRCSICKLCDALLEPQPAPVDTGGNHDERGVTPGT